MGNRSSRWMNALAVALAAVGVVTVGAILLLGRVGEAPDIPEPPAIQYDPVRILEVTSSGLVRVPQVDGFDKPSLMVGDDVPLEFSRCADFGDDVDMITALSTTYWVNQDSGDEFLHADPVEVELSAGCITVRVALGMPNAVAVANVGNFAASADELPTLGTWTITGTLDPVDDEFDAVSWRTEQFFLVNAVPPRFPPNPGPSDSPAGG